MRELRIPNTRGRMFLTAMPGRYEPLEEALVEIERCGQLIVLTSDEEIAHKSPTYGRWLAARSPDATPRVVRLPIDDYGVPADLEFFVSRVRDTANWLTAGESIVVHCGAGIGRTGTFATCVLLALGASVQDALEAVSEAGSGPETSEQHALVQTLSDRGVLTPISE